MPEALVESLEHDDNRIRAQVMPLLALIRDPRGLPPLLAMVRDRDPRMREIAARCLGRFPSADTIATLETFKIVTFSTVLLDLIMWRTGTSVLLPHRQPRGLAAITNVRRLTSPAAQTLYHRVL